MSLPPPSKDRTALVTGASSGIGAELARELARRGHGVTLVARRKERLTELAEELAATGVRAEALDVDLSDRAARAALPPRVAELGLEVDVLVNNAGLSTTGAVSRADVDAELNMIEVDVAAVADLCTRFIPAMAARRSGAVLNVASTAAFQPLPGQAGYAACKAFVLSYTRALGGELRGSGVTATALCPGPVETGFGDAAGFTEAETHGSMPSFMWEDVTAVARAGVDGLDAGRAVVIPGVANRVTALLSRMTPKQVLVPILAKGHPALRRP